MIIGFLSRINFDIDFLFKYVDDLLTSLHKDKLQESLQIINSIDAKMKFTYEVEIDGRIPFLDLLVINNEGSLEFDLYKKPTSSSRLLNFYSDHPIQHKTSIVNQMFHKVQTLCSSPYKQRNLDKVKNQLKINNYPMSFVNKVAYTKNRIGEDNQFNLTNTKRNESEPPTVKNFFKVPYHKNLAPKINNVFKKYEAKPVFYNTRSSRQFFGKVKDKTAKENKSGIVYRIDCDCGDHYIGQTKQYLKNRINQHKNDIRKGRSNTGLSAHIQNNPDHKIDWENTKIIDSAPRDNVRLFYEMCHVVSDDRSMNIQNDYKNFSNMYKNLIKTFK